jgi:branched-chain amino acid transport system ATP-binding protein
MSTTDALLDAHPPSPEAEIVLEAASLTKDFSGFRAVDGVNLQVRRGTVHGLIGPNGAGKTTCFNLLTKFLSPSAGRITYKGRDITGLKPAAVARLGLVRSFQISAVFDKLSVRDNIRVALQRRRGHCYDFWRSERCLAAFDAEAAEFAERVGLAALLAMPAGELSYGRKRALELATTLALDPDMLLLDEPMAGMGQEDIERTTELIRGIAAGRTILMVEHNLSVVSSLSQRITVLARGKVLAEGDYARVSADPRVVEAYIGGGHG